MHNRFGWTRLLVLALVAAVVAVITGAPAVAAGPQLTPKYTAAKAFDVSKPFSVLANQPSAATLPDEEDDEDDEVIPDNVFQPDLALQQSAPSVAIAAPAANFDGLSNQDNFNLYGGRVNPPDPVGDVGPNHYVELINLAFAVYNKTGTRLLGPTKLGALWAGFPIEDCTDPSGDPVVLYDQFTDRWILTQFTTRGLDDPNKPNYDCVAVSVTGDPTGAYYRYAFITQPDPETATGTFFPDYPKYSVWKDSIVLTTRDFGLTTGYGISVYALDKNKLVNGDPKARAVQFFLDGNDPAILPLIGDGLLPADVDGKTKPKTATPIPIIGTQDDGFTDYGATSDAINIWELNVQWNSRPDASLVFRQQLPVTPFDSIFPCGPDSRDCLPQPGITNPAQFLDTLSSRQRATYRFAWRSFANYDSMVATQSVEARPGIAGMRWYEIRRVNGAYSIYQQGTFAPNDGVHRWMGSVAQDKNGGIALGYSVVNGTTVFPGIRYTGRLAGDPLGQMTLGEGTIINGSGVQRTTNSRWGDYTSLNVDPVDDCTFWYVNEYYTAAGQATSPAGWQTRIANFKLPGCN